MVSRRHFIQSSASLALVASKSDTLLGQNNGRSPEVLNKGFIYELLNTSIDMATSLGANFCEATITRETNESMSYVKDRNPQMILGVALRSDDLGGFGVRVLVDGSWGFAASNTWTKEEGARLASIAVAQARANSREKKGIVDWLSLAIESGEWITPGVDPLSIPFEEKADLLNSWRQTVLNYRSSEYSVRIPRDMEPQLYWSRAERVYANSDGATQYQRFYYILQGRFALTANSKKEKGMSSPKPVQCGGVSGSLGGWEVVRDARLHEQIPQLIEASAKTPFVPVATIDVGRYDLVLDPTTVSHLVSSTFASATELDRALGYEANAAGTTFLGPDPLEHLGSQVAHSSLNIRCNRTSDGQLATAKWDSEGARTKDFPIIKDGMLWDFQINRELLAKMQPWYRQQSLPISSNGCSVAKSADFFPLIGPSNVEVVPSKDDVTITDLISEIKKGYYLTAIPVRTSFQLSDGFGIGEGREIINGRLGGSVKLGILFNTKELWKSITGIGGKSTVASNPFSRGGKGQPVQADLRGTISSVPISFSNVAVIEPGRKA